MSVETPQPKKQYYYDLDVLKAILVIGMIIDHAIILLGDAPVRRMSDELKFVIQLVSYSGFLFTFGYTTWLSYFSKQTNFKRILPGVLRIVIAYYISAFLYSLFVERAYGNADLLNILFLNRIILYAEFLLAFALTLVAGYLLKAPIGYILERPRIFFVVVGVFLLTTFIPNSQVTSPILSLFIGSPKPVATTFPLLQYFAIYLLGIYFARYQVRPNIFIGLAGILVYYFYARYALTFTRYPPSFAWVFFSFFFVLIWYAIAKFISRWSIVNRFLVPVGANSLFYMLASNIMIFAFRGAMPKLGGAMSLRVLGVVIFAIIATIYFLTTIVRHVEVKETPTEPERSA